MEKLLLVDGNALLHRAYHAYPRLVAPSGEVVGAVYGFTVMLLTAIEKIAPTHVAVAWDVGKITFRHEHYAEYKAGRAEMDQELVDQVERTKEVVTALNMPQFGVPSFEADDVIGTLAYQAVASKINCQVVIATGDRDALQLVDGKRVVVYMPAASWRMQAGKPSSDRGVSIYDEEAVKAKYGLSPRQIVDLKALMGDASDNIKGVRGIGQVTATKLLTEAGSVEEIYKNIERLAVSERVKDMLGEGKASAFLSKELATINRKVPIKLSWRECKLSDYNRDGVLDLFNKLNFKSLVNRLPKDSWEEDLMDVFKK